MFWESKLLNPYNVFFLPAAKSGQYIPKTDKVLFHTKMVPPISGESLRFMAPTESGEYPYICSFPGHWTIMKGVMVVK